MVIRNTEYYYKYSTLIVIISLSFLASWSVHGQTVVPICGFPPFDVNNLTSRIWESVETTQSCLNRSGLIGEGCHYYFAICHDLNSLGSASCANSSVCEQGTAKTKPAYSLGQYDPMPFNHSAKSYGYGFTVSFKNGANWTRTDNTTCAIGVQMQFECNFHRPWLLGNESVPNTIPVPISYLWNESACIYEMKMQYAGACVVIPPGPGQDSDDMGTGTILLIIFFSSILVYFTLGATYNALADGKRGLEIIPNYEFWKSLPGAIGHGILFIATCGRHKKDPYDSI